MQYASPFLRDTVAFMEKAKSDVRVSVDLPTALHEKFFNRCKFKLGGLSMNKRIIQLVMADVAGSIDVPHEPSHERKKGK